MKKLVAFFLVFILFSSSVYGEEYNAILKNLDFPSVFRFSPDFKDSIFIAEHNTGLIKKINLKSLKSETFINLKDKIYSEGWEAGLNSFSFSPNYKKDKNVFVNYVNKNNDVVVSKIIIKENLQNIEKEILKIKNNINNYSHYCGYMVFDNKNFLNICVGDLNNIENPYNLNSLSGKILRINVLNEETYSMPKENPFFGSNKGRGEILFYGLRNPWKFSINNNNYFIPDVGDSLWEELNIIENYNKINDNYNGFGWPYYEGLEKRNIDSINNQKLLIGFNPPIATYPYGFGCSIIGGDVYLGKKFPKWKGTYIFSDLCLGKIWGLKKFKDKYMIKEVQNLNVQPVYIGSDLNGELLILTLEGKLIRLNFPNYEENFLDTKIFFLKNLQKITINKTREQLKSTTTWKIGDGIVKILKIFKIDFFLR